MELTTQLTAGVTYNLLFMMSKIQNLNGTHNKRSTALLITWLFMMSKIQNLNGTHNSEQLRQADAQVVYDVKDTKFEWNSQLYAIPIVTLLGCL